MLGKTHVVGSLALGHLGLLGYFAYKNKDIESPDATYAEPFTLWGLEIGTPMGIIAYSLMVLATLLMVLILLRIGSGMLRLGFLILILFMTGGAYYLNDTTYGFDLLLIAVLFGLGSLFPDIDTPTSTIGKYFPFVGSIIGHRTVTHTIWAVLLLGGLTWYFSSIYLLAFTVGYTLHIIEDSFSRQGIAWFYPVVGGYNTFGSGAVMKQGRKPGKFAYHTGGTGEEVFFYASIVVNIACVGVIYWHHFM